MRGRLTTLTGRAITVAIELTWSTPRPDRSGGAPIVTIDADLRSATRDS